MLEQICAQCVLSHVRLSATSRTVACQAPLSMEFSRQEYWSGLPVPTSRDLSDSGIKLLRLLHWQANEFFTNWEELIFGRFSLIILDKTLLIFYLFLGEVF